MKCPKCKKILTDYKKTPEGLLNHISKTKDDYIRRKNNILFRIENIPNSTESLPMWMDDTIEKWQSWHDWVEKKILEENNNGN